MEVENIELKNYGYQAWTLKAIKNQLWYKDFSDVTLVTEDQYLVQSHRVILSSCSSFFRNILTKHLHPNPLIFLKGVNKIQLNAIMEYIYLGETQIAESALENFTSVTKILQIEGLNEENIQNIPIHLEERVDLKFKCKKCSMTFKNKSEQKKHILALHPRNYPCKLCEQIFETSFSLESHLKVHDAPKLFKCQYCEKMFYMKWRLEKHIKQHESNDGKYCRYFNNDKYCPFEENGCMFLHKYYVVDHIERNNVDNNERSNKVDNTEIFKDYNSSDIEAISEEYGSKTIGSENETFYPLNYFLEKYGNEIDKFKEVKSGHCWACFVDGAVQTCSGCKNASYCDKKCQRQDWPHHKKYCKEVKRKISK